LVWLAKLPELPVTVTVTEPVAATAEAAKVKVLPDVALLGLKDAVTPAGRPDAARVTLPLKPFRGVIVIVVLTLAPCTTVTVPGEADSEKFSAGAVAGQLFTRFAALTLPMPVAKSQPTDVPYAGLNAPFEVESTPTDAPPK
jgi:hypothetical protein